MTGAKPASWRRADARSRSWSTATSAQSSADSRTGWPAEGIDDVAHDALVKAIAQAFRGSSHGEFRARLHRIIDGTRADWYRRAARRPREEPLPGEHAQDENLWGDEPHSNSDTGAVELRIIVDEVLAGLNDTHR